MKSVGIIVEICIKLLVKEGTHRSYVGIIMLLPVRALLFIHKCPNLPLSLHSWFSHTCDAKPIAHQPSCRAHIRKISGHQQLSEGYTTLAERSSTQLEVKKSKFVAWAAPVDSENAAFGFLDEVRDPRATHNCWGFKIQKTYRFNDDGEPGGTAGKPIYSSITTSGLDGVMVVVTRYYGGIKLGTGGLVRAYGGVSLDCLRGAKTVVVKPKAEMELFLPFDLLGVLYPLMQVYQVEKLEEKYDLSGKGGTCLRVLVEVDKALPFEQAVRNGCGGQAKIKCL